MVADLELALEATFEDATSASEYIDNVLGRLSFTPPQPNESTSLAANESKIADVFGSNECSVETVFAALEERHCDWSKNTLKVSLRHLYLTTVYSALFYDSDFIITVTLGTKGN